jgi:hypothetical protein
MEVKIDLTSGTATVIFNDSPTAIIEKYRHSISYDEVSNYRKRGHTVYYANPEYRDPYVLKDKVVGSNWKEYIDSMNELREQITLAENIGITVTNKESYEKVYKRALKQYAQLLEKGKQENKHRRLIKLLSSQDYETLVTLIETASWHLLDHYEYEHAPIPPKEQAVIDIKTKWDTISRIEG